jgi:hypothetical protein
VPSRAALLLADMRERALHTHTFIHHTDTFCVGLRVLWVSVGGCLKLACAIIWDHWSHSWQFTRQLLLSQPITSADACTSGGGSTAIFNQGRQVQVHARLARTFESVSTFLFLFAMLFDCFAATPRSACIFSLFLSMKDTSYSQQSACQPSRRRSSRSSSPSECLG